MLKQPLDLTNTAQILNPTLMTAVFVKIMICQLSLSLVTRAHNLVFLLWCTLDFPRHFDLVVSFDYSSVQVVQVVLDFCPSAQRFLTSDFFSA
jgi:hypothetical protein